VLVAVANDGRLPIGPKLSAALATLAGAAGTTKFTFGSVLRVVTERNVRHRAFEVLLANCEAKSTTPVMERFAEFVVREFLDGYDDEGIHVRHLDAI